MESARHTKVSQRSPIKRISIVFIGIVLLGIIILLLRQVQRNQSAASTTNYTAGKFSVAAEKKGTDSSTNTTQCAYTVSYQEQKIPLGTYPEIGSCDMSQTPTLSNGMLAVMTQAYVFLYDPKAQQIIKLDPTAVPGFPEFAQTNNLNIYTDFPLKRFLFSGNTLQILYTRKPDDTRKPSMLSFISPDNGKTFIFDKQAGF